MKSYGSFLVRWWLISNETEGERNVLEIEHIQSGEHHKGASIAEAQGWMLSRCQVPPIDSRDSADRARKPQRLKRRAVK